MAGAPAPYVPTVTHELDTQNFEEFEEKEAASGSASNRRRLRADPNFIGYTYKNWEAVSPRQGEHCLPLAAASIRHASEMMMSATGVLHRLLCWYGNELCLPMICGRGKSSLGALWQWPLAVSGNHLLHILRCWCKTGLLPDVLWC